MTTDERVLRLENAFATLAQLAADHEDSAREHNRRLDVLTEIAAKSNERADERVAKTDARLNRLAEIVERNISEKRNEN